MTKSFAGLLEYFVVTFALKEAGYSKETLRSYYTAVEQYIQWVCRIRSIPVEDVDVTCFRKDLIRAFLIHLEEDNAVKDNSAVFCYSNAQELLFDYTPNRFDVLLLDIQMEGENGISLAKRIRSLKEIGRAHV